MIGAVLSLVLIGLITFGMGLKNIQDQVQTIAIGGLLIGSILLASAVHGHFRSRPQNELADGRPDNPIHLYFFRFFLFLFLVTRTRA